MTIETREKWLPNGMCFFKFFLCRCSACVCVCVSASVFGVWTWICFDNERLHGIRVHTHLHWWANCPCLIFILNDLSTFDNFDEHFLYATHTHTYTYTHREVFHRLVFGSGSSMWCVSLYTNGAKYSHFVPTLSLYHTQIPMKNFTMSNSECVCLR